MLLAFMLTLTLVFQLMHISSLQMYEYDRAPDVHAHVYAHNKIVNTTIKMIHKHKLSSCRLVCIAGVGIYS